MKDTIYRQDAIDALQKEINKGIPPFDDVMGSIRCGVRLARNIIEDLPSAEPDADLIHLQREQAYMQGFEDGRLQERKTGKWIPYNGDKEDWLRSDGTPVFMQCSECNAMVVNNFAFRWNFCPNCGAKMEGEE